MRSFCAACGKLRVVVSWRSWTYRQVQSKGPKDEETAPDDQEEDCVGQHDSNHGAHTQILIVSR